MIVNNVWKYPKKRNKIKERSITRSYIWHVIQIHNLCDELCAKFGKKRNKVKKHSISCSHIWHINISVCVYWLHIQSVNIWRHNNSDMNGQNNIWKYPKKMQLNLRTFHYQQSHLTCWHTKMCTLIRNTICECLVNIQYFTWILVNNVWKYPKSAIKSKDLP